MLIGFLPSVIIMRSQIGKVKCITFVFEIHVVDLLTGLIWFR